MFNLRLHSSLYFTFLNPDLCCQFLASRQSLVVFVWFRHRRRLVAGRCLLFTETLEAVAVVVPNRPQVLDTVPKVHFHSAEHTVPTVPNRAVRVSTVPNTHIPKCRTGHNFPDTVPNKALHSAEHTRCRTHNTLTFTPGRVETGFWSGSARGLSFPRAGLAAEGLSLTLACL